MKLDKIEYIDRKTNKMLVENVPGENFLKFLYHNPFGKLPLELLVKRKCLSSFYGKLMDKKNSINKIEDFVRDNHIDMSESQKKVGEFISFNDFFYRKLKPNARKIEDGLVSPADGKAIGFQEINDWDKSQVEIYKDEVFTANEDKTPDTTEAEEILGAKVTYSGPPTDENKVCPSCTDKGSVVDNRDKKSDPKFSKIPDYACQKAPYGSGCGWAAWSGNESIPSEWI